MDTRVAPPRERYRARVRAEIKELAREQIATTGVAALSLKAIAQRLGLSGPALYRYFAGRDELITELIRDAYRSLADAIGGADAGVGGLARVVRAWAIGDPQRYLLIYGTPVPGYHAPGDTTAIAREIMAAVVAAYRRCEVLPSGGLLETHLDHHRQWAADPAVPAATLRRALAFWTRLHGVLSLELAGHFTGMGFDPALLFADEVDDLLERPSEGTLAGVARVDDPRSIAERQ